MTYRIRKVRGPFTEWDVLAYNETNDTEHIYSKFSGPDAKRRAEDYVYFLANASSEEVKETMDNIASQTSGRIKAAQEKLSATSDSMSDLPEPRFVRMDKCGGYDVIVLDVPHADDVPGFTRLEYVRMKGYAPWENTFEDWKWYLLPDTVVMANDYKVFNLVCRLEEWHRKTTFEAACVGENPTPPPAPDTTQHPGEVIDLAPKPGVDSMSLDVPFDLLVELCKRVHGRLNTATDFSAAVYNGAQDIEDTLKELGLEL